MSIPSRSVGLLCFTYAFVLLGCFLIMSQPAWAGEELGIDRSNLSQQGKDIRDKTLQGIHDLHAVWFRDGPKRATPEGIASFVDEVREAKQQGLKFLMIVGPLDEDFDSALGTNRCGWGATKLSQINLTKFAQRLSGLLDALKGANATVDAVEFGNELDHDCYDADVPSGRQASQQEVIVWLRGYARFLKTGAEILHNPKYFPQAKIITFGIAHGSDKWDWPPHHIENPAQMVAMLRNLDGFNYLDNAEYHVDGYGTHIYPSPNDIAQSVSSTLEEDATALGRDKPLWVTEWGFLDAKAFPTKKGQTLSQALEEFLRTFEGLARSVSLGPIMFYRYDVWLTDTQGNLLPPANVLSAYASKR